MSAISASAGSLSIIITRAESFPAAARVNPTASTFEIAPVALTRTTHGSAAFAALPLPLVAFGVTAAPSIALTTAASSATKPSIKLRSSLLIRFPSPNLAKRRRGFASTCSTAMAAPFLPSRGRPANFGRPCTRISTA